MSNEIMNTSEFEFNSNVFVSFVPEDDTDRALVYKALNAADCRLSDLINTEVSVRDFTVENITLHNEDGSERPGVRIGLILSDGRTVRTSSNGIFRALKSFIAIYGKPSWKPGITAKVIQEDRNGMRTFNLVPVFKK